MGRAGFGAAAGDRSAGRGEGHPRSGRPWRSGAGNTGARWPLCRRCHMTGPLRRGLRPLKEGRRGDAEPPLSLAGPRAQFSDARCPWSFVRGRSPAGPVSKSSTEERRIARGAPEAARWPRSRAVRVPGRAALAATAGPGPLPLSSPPPLRLLTLQRRLLRLSRARRGGGGTAVREGGGTGRSRGFDCAVPPPPPGSCGDTRAAAGGRQRCVPAPLALGCARAA